MKTSVFVNLLYLNLAILLFSPTAYAGEKKNNYGISNSRRQENAPPYIPKQYFNNEHLYVRGNIVRDRDTDDFIAPVGYGIGKMPSKSSHKQFNPQKIRRRSGFGLGRALFGGGS